MKIDNGPFLKGGITILDNAVTVKDGDDFVWTKIRIGLNYWDYECKYPKEIQPDETCTIAFSDFVLADYLHYTDMSRQFDGKKWQGEKATKPHYQITFEAEEGHNYVDLPEKNIACTMLNKRENVILSYTR